MNTLYKLLNRYSIKVPQIQRDYVQGKKGKEKLRTGFISNIKKALNSEDSLNLDFVYGYTEAINETEKAFIPMDGQQRLTTLWLLHWFLAPKEKIKEQHENKEDAEFERVPEEIKIWLKKFTYETRNSSKRFCQELIDNTLPCSDKNLSDLIEDASWFMSSWRNDPTVVSMLNMLDTIQKGGFDKKKDWENIIANEKITFDYIDIRSGDFKLTDELYIKMNSRGKPLTPFENFKASFSEILSSPDTDYSEEKRVYKGSKVTYQQYFAFKIDRDWMDLFWSFSKQNDNSVDDCLMNYFDYIAQMCYFKDNLDKTAEDDRDIFLVFKKKDNVLFLFGTLDWLYNVSCESNQQVDSMLIDSFFSKIFQTKKIDETYDNQIRLFDEDKVPDYNLFKKCLIEGSKFDNRYRIILYCMFSYVMKYNLVHPNQELKNLIRVVRNLLQATRQRNETVYNTNVRIKSFGNYWKLFAQLLECTNVYDRLIENIDNEKTDISIAALHNEIQKAEILLEGNIDIKALFKLEEFKPFGGLIHQLKPQKNKDKLAQYSQAVREIWNNNNKEYLVIGAMIASGFKGFHTKRCRLGEMWLFGKNEKKGWNTILTSNEEDISESIIQLLDDYISDTHLSSTEEKLQNIIDRYLNNLTEKNWQYYFLKYPKMLSGHCYFASDHFHESGSFEIRKLSSLGSNPLLAYHINPYVLVVSNLLDNTICVEGDCYSIYSNSRSSGLKLKNGIILYCVQGGWEIVLPPNYQLDNILMQKYSINNEWLVESDGKDRIEIAVDFCKELYGSNS
jgi:hypothetical protein